jgi:hypothetical protein
VEAHLDERAEARHRLVDRVVDDLEDEVVESARSRVAHVHAGALADRLDALEHLDAVGAVGVGGGVGLGVQVRIWHLAFSI